jgi:hypothetical protein
MQNMREISFVQAESVVVYPVDIRFHHRLSTGETNSNLPISSVSAQPFPGLVASQLQKALERSKYSRRTKILSVSIFLSAFSLLLRGRLLATSHTLLAHS